MLPNLASSQGNTHCTKKLTAELIKPTNEIAKPRIRLGKSSEKSTHITGPIEMTGLLGFSQVNLPINFDSTNVNYNLVSFGGNADSIVSDPAGGTNMVMRAIKSNTAQLWAGTTMGDSGLASAIPFASNANSMNVRIYSPDSGIPVRLKVEDASDPTKSVETEATTSTSNAWETLTFDFSNQAAGTAAINYTYSYDKVSIFFNFGTDGATAGTKTYYADDVQFGAAAGASAKVDLPINFDSTNVNYDLVSFGGNSDSIATDPAGGTNKVLRATKSNTAQLWAGTTMGDNGLATAIPFAANANIMKVRVYSPDSGVPIRLKVEDASDPAISVETEDTTTTSNAWETLTFDFSKHVSGTSAINYANTYDKVSIFFNFGTTGATAGTKTYYADDVEFVPAGGGGGPQLAQVDLPIRFDSTNVNYNIVSFGGNTDTIVTDPAGGTNMVLSATKSNTAQLWSGTTMGDNGLAQAIPFASNANKMTVRVYSPDSGVPIRLKVEDASDPAISVETEVNTTVANAWDTLTFDFSQHVSGTSAINYSNTYDKVSIFFNFGTTGAMAGTKTYYADDVEFVSTAGGGGGGPQLAQVDLPISFDSTNVNYDLVSFGGNLDTIVTDPAGGSNKVMRATKANTAQLWAGTSMGGSGLASAIPFTPNNNTMSVRVYSPDAGIPIRLKVEDVTDPTISVETEAMTTVANAWDTLVFDFSNQAPGTAAINYSNTYDLVSIFFNFGTDGATAGTKVYYCDDVEFGGTTGGGGGGGPQLAQVDLPISFDSTNVDYATFSFGGNVDSITTDPAGGPNQVLLSTKTASAQTWSGTTMGNNGLASAIPFTPNDNFMSVKVYSPDAGTPILLKVEDATDPAISVETFDTTTVANAWETLTFDFTKENPGTPAIDYANTYDKVSIFFNFGTDGATAGEKTYYADDVVFGNSVGIAEQSINTFSMSPNPSNGLLYLSGNLIQEGAALISVRNVQGQLMMQHNQNAGQGETQLDLSSLQSGIYFITVQGERTMHTEKLVLKP